MNAEPLSSEPAIRVLAPAEASVYAEFRRAMLADAPLAFASSPETDPACDPAELAKRLAGPGQSISAAYVGPVLASAAGLFREPKPKMNHRATIWGVWTRPEFRGRGLADRVIRHALGVARSWPGLRIVSLSANVSQSSAIRLYTRLGFRAWGIEPNVLMLDGTLHDEIHMQIVLDRSTPTA